MISQGFHPTGDPDYTAKAQKKQKLRYCEDCNIQIVAEKNRKVCLACSSDRQATRSRKSK